jgi:hypothetical protein
MYDSLSSESRQKHLREHTLMGCAARSTRTRRSGDTAKQTGSPSAADDEKRKLPGAKNHMSATCQDKPTTLELLKVLIAGVHHPL